MAKINRYDGNLQAFASQSIGTERTIFGETGQANDLTSQINADFLRGWAIVGPADQPTLQDFNGAMYTHGQLLAYLHQVGVPSYNAAQEYQDGGITVSGGVIYLSIQDANVGNTPASSPLWWKNPFAEGSTFFAATKAAGDALAAGLGDGATVIVDRDETLGGVSVRYTVSSSALTSPVILNLNVVESVGDLVAGNADGVAVNVRSYHAGLNTGGGTLYWDASGDKGWHNGGTVIDPTRTFPSDWDNQPQVAAWFTAGTGTGVWRRPYSTRINVLEFGAKGAENEISSFKAAGAAIQSGMTFYIPALEYTYYLDDGQIIDFNGKNGVSVIAENGSKINVHQDATQNGQVAFAKGHGNDFLADGLVVNHVISGSPSPLAGARATVIWSQSDGDLVTKGITLKNCWVRLYHPMGANMGVGSLDGKLIGFYIYGNYLTQNRVERVTIDNCTFVDTRARVIWLWHTRDVIATNNRFINSGEYPCFRCLAGNEDMVFRGNKFYMPLNQYASHGIYLNGQTSQSKNIVIEDNYFELSSSRAIGIDGTKDVTIRNNIIKTNPLHSITSYEPLSFISYGDTDAELQVSGVTISGNVFETKNVTIIGIPSAASDPTVRYSDFVIKDNVFSLIDSGYSGFRSPAEAVCQRFTISGNVLKNCGMRVNCLDSVVEDNVVRSTGTACIYTSSTAALGLTVSRNTVQINSPAGSVNAMDILAGNVYISNNYVLGIEHNIGINAPFTGTGRKMLAYNRAITGTGVAIFKGSNVDSIGNIVDNALLV